MNNPTNNKFVMVLSLLFAVLLFVLTPAWSADNGSSRSDRYGKKDISKKAIEKVGFFGGVVDGRVQLKDSKTYRDYTYLASPEMIVTRDGLPIDILKVWPDSIVKLIIVDAEVVEIILVRESS